MDLIPAFVCLECPRMNDEMLGTRVWWKQQMIVVSSQFSADVSWVNSDALCKPVWKVLIHVCWTKDQEIT